MQKLILCFDLGGTYLKYGLATPRGEILHHSKLRSGGTGSLASVTAPFLEAAELMRVQAEKSGGIISAAGVGTPGVVEQTTGTIIGSSPNVPALVGISLKNLLEAELKVPVTVDNDANLATLGEAVCGAGQGFNSVLGLTLGTGIGGGFVQKGEIYRGEHGSAMEVGHILIDFRGRRCKCGKRGCVEAYASGTALIKRANFLGKKQRLINAQKFTKTRPLFESAKTGYPPAITAIREGVEALTSALASLINTLDPACAVIGGGVMFGYLNFWGEIEAGVRKKAVDAFAGKIPILPAKLGNMAGLAGAALAGGRGG